MTLERSNLHYHTALIILFYFISSFFTISSVILILEDCQWRERKKGHLLSFHFPIYMVLWCVDSTLQYPPFTTRNGHNQLHLAISPYHHLYTVSCQHNLETKPQEEEASTSPRTKGSSHSWEPPPTWPQTPSNLGHSLQNPWPHHDPQTWPNHYHSHVLLRNCQINAPNPRQFLIQQKDPRCHERL